MTAAHAGRLVTDTLPYDGGRGITVYVPAATPTAIVYAGDGQTIAPWGADLEGTGLSATMIVGTHRAADETLRIHEYSAGADTAEFAFDPERFAAHERFFAETVPEWVGARFGIRLPADRTAVLGVSAGAELALAMGVRHPDLYGAVLGASPGAGYRPPEHLPSPPRTYLVAGREEPFFLENAARWGDALGRAGSDVVFEERDGGHGDPFWRAELPAMIRWAFAD